jgi:hypothetical protein
MVQTFLPDDEKEEKGISGTSKPAASLARRLDRLPDGYYVLLLNKRGNPASWFIQLVPVKVETVELER